MSKDFHCSFNFIVGNVSNNELALKFTHKSQAPPNDKEYEIFKALHAIDNPDVILNGVPALLYHSVVNEFDIMGITLLGQCLFLKFIELKYKFTWITILLIFQKMIRILKYIHGCGVVHNDIKPQNIHLYGTELVLIGKTAFVFCKKFQI